MEEKRQKDNMGSALKRRDYLTLLANSKDVKRRKALLDVATKQEIDAISECLLNIVNGHVRISPSKIGKLKKIKRHLKDLTNKRCSFREKKANSETRRGILNKYITGGIVCARFTRWGSLGSEVGNEL